MASYASYPVIKNLLNVSLIDDLCELVLLFNSAAEVGNNMRLVVAEIKFLGDFADRK